MSSVKRILAGAATLVGAAMLCACAAGPDYRRPEAPATTGYVAGTLPSQTEQTGEGPGRSQRFIEGGEPSGVWWKLFGSQQLDALVEKAMLRNPDITAQQAALRAAREQVRAQQGLFFPQVQARFGQQRGKVSGASIAPDFPSYTTSLYQANVSIAYTLDVFGGERRQIESLRAQEEYQRFVLEASYLTLTANVAATAIQLAAAREQINATQEIIGVEEKQLAIIERQYALGTHTKADVLQQQSNLASVRATLPALEQQLDSADHQMAALVGEFPHDAAAVDLSLNDLSLPADLPVSLPSALVAQRPDIRQHEAQLHEASAQIGVATANLLPQVTLSASAGEESLLFSSLFKPGSGIWGLASSLTAPVFAGGTLRARRRAAIDTFEQAAAQYRQTVLLAFENVADTLTALQHDAEALKAQSDALDAARASLELIQRQYEAGAVNYVTLLTAQQQYQQSRIGSVRASAGRFADTVALFQALGGGWWNRKQADEGTVGAIRDQKHVDDTGS